MLLLATSCPASLGNARPIIADAATGRTIPRQSGRCTPGSVIHMPGDELSAAVRAITVKADCRELVQHEREGAQRGQCFVRVRAFAGFITVVTLLLVGRGLVSRLYHAILAELKKCRATNTIYDDSIRTCFPVSFIINLLHHQSTHLRDTTPALID